MPSSKPQKLYHHGNLRDTLIRTGLDLIAEKGVRALTLREIGARAGVSRSAAYRHFKDKSDLLSAISEAGFTQFADALEAARRGDHPDISSQLRAMAVAYVRFAVENPSHFEVMFSSPGNPAEKQDGTQEYRAFSILEQVIREGQEAAEFRSGDSRLLAQVAWAHVHGISTLGFGTGFTPFSAEVLMTGLNVKSSIAAQLPLG